MKVISIGPNEASKFDEEISIRPAFVKFYMPGCGYCKAMKEDWDNLGKEMMNDNRVMSIIEVHSDAVNNIKSNVTKNVNGYPTIMMVYKNGNEFKMYQGDRSTSDMKEFINDNFEKINGMSGGSKSRRTKSKSRRIKSKSKRTKSKSKRTKSKSKRTKSKLKSSKSKSKRSKSKSKRSRK